MNKRAGITAADILNDYDEERLADIFYLYGELKQSRRIASAIVKARGQKTYKTTNDLLTTIEPFFQRAREKKDMAKMFSPSHRSKPRDGCLEGNAYGSNRTASPWR